jgi:hypothetical protein
MIEGILATNVDNQLPKTGRYQWPFFQKLTGTTQMSKKNEQKKREKIHTVRPAGLKTRRSFSYTIITKNSCFFWFDCAVALCKIQN